MFELPLFPLNTVLFPGAPLNLHIFEPRYQRMIGMCLREHRPFGVALIRRGQEALGALAEPYDVGCTATIVHHQPLEQGRMNIVGLGGERFRLQAVDRQSAPYLVGECEEMPLAPAQQDLSEAGRDLRQRVERFITTALAAGNVFDMQQIPDKPVELAYLAAALLQIAPHQKQELLELNKPEDLLLHTRRLYAREQPLLEAMLSHRSPPNTMPFSQN